MKHYCTLFDSRYLPQGLVLYHSLLKHSSERFMLHILPMDVPTHVALKALELPRAALVNSVNFEIRTEMGLCRQNRTWQEFCWTAASNLCEYLMRDCVMCEWDGITYLDADMMFFSDPKVVFDEIGERSIAIVPHRFIPSKQYLEVNGTYNVSWVSFANTNAGRECLSVWANQCRNWCRAVNEGDRYGDQKYLNAWPGKYGDDLCVIENIGVGLAPWNLANYALTEGPTVDGVPVVFYHYHEWLVRDDDTIRLTNYDLRPEDERLIYAPYLRAYTQAMAGLEALSDERHCV